MMNSLLQSTAILQFSANLCNPFPRLPRNDSTFLDGTSLYFGFPALQTLIPCTLSVSAH